MTIVSNDPSWWLEIDFARTFSYFAVAAFTAVVYDWALKFGQEFELVWRRRWSPMTIMYVGVRYVGILHPVVNILVSLPSVSVTDAECTILYFVQNWMSVVVNAMLGVILIVRLHAMYQRSRNMLIFLVVIFLAVTIPSGVITSTGRMEAEELVLSGTHLCYYNFEDGDAQLLIAATWILITIWEVLALGLAIWIAAKHFRELQRPSTGWTVGDCFTVLIKTHVLYFAAFAGVSCLTLGMLSPKISKLSSEGVQIYLGFYQIARLVQMVLGPRLILGVREYNAKLIDNSDEEIFTTTITVTFEERVQLLPTDSDV